MTKKHYGYEKIDPIDYAYNHAAYQVVSDPDPDAGYFPGARFGIEELRLTESFDDGMVVKDLRNGNLLELVGCEWRKR